MARSLHTGFAGERIPEECIMEFLTDGSVIDMSVDGSASAGAIDFRYTVPAGKVCLLERLTMTLQDASQSIDEFTGIGALSNGIAVGFYDSSDNLILAPLGDETIKIGGDFALLAGVDVETVGGAPGATDDILMIRWTFRRSFGGPIKLSAGRYLQLKVQDNLGAITSIKAHVQGSFITN